MAPQQKNSPSCFPAAPTCRVLSISFHISRAEILLTNITNVRKRSAALTRIDFWHLKLWRCWRLSSLDRKGCRTPNQELSGYSTENKVISDQIKGYCEYYEFEWRTVTARFIVSLQQDSMFVISFCRFDLQKTSSSSVYLIQFSRFFSVINKWNSLLMTYLSEATTIPPIVGDLWVPNGQSHVGKILNGSVAYQCMDNLYSLTAKMWKTAVSTHVI